MVCVRPRIRAAAFALLVFLSLFPVLGADGRRPETRHGTKTSLYHPAAVLRRQDCTELKDGLVITQFQLRYGGMAGAVTAVEMEITICFSCGGILPGENVWVKLPGFTRKNVLSLSDAMFAQPLSTEGKDAMIFKSAVWDEQTHTLRFICTQTARNGKTYSVTVPLDGGLTAPPRGIRSNALFHYHTDSCNGGPREPETVLQSKFPPVGFFASSSIDFEPREAGAVSQISISLTPDMNIKSLELISVELPRFICQQEAPCSKTLFSGDVKLQSNLTATFSALSTWTAGDILDGSFPFIFPRSFQSLLLL